MNLKFLGSNRTVTGSKHLLKGKEHNILIDCGLYQGTNDQKQNQEITKLLLNEQIDAIILTHAHLDHCGYIPKLYKDGFRGPIFTTAATFDIAKIILSDNAKIQSKNAKVINKKVSKEKNKTIPLYTQTEVNQVLANFEIKDFNKPFKWNEFSIILKKAGHILGAASPLIVSENIKIQFSGDLGRADDTIMYPPDECSEVDFLVLESTYGDREHKQTNLSEQFKEIFSKAIKQNQAIIVPAFSVGRSQIMMKILFDFFKKNPELKIPVYVDSPMTQAVTEIYHKHPELHKINSSDLKAIEKEFHFIQYKKQKDSLDKNESAHIILTASGMLSGGNILHHLPIKGINENNIIFIVGFQAPGTIGYDLLNGQSELMFEGKAVKIQAKIYNISSLSSHADHNALIQWAMHSKAKQIFLTHGERNSKEQLKSDLQKETNSSVLVPNIEDEIALKL